MASGVAAKWIILIVTHHKCCFCKVIFKFVSVMLRLKCVSDKSNIDELPVTALLFILPLKAGFRNQMLNAINGFSMSNQNGLFINSCFAHCQSERQDTWYANDSPRIGNKVCLIFS